MIVEFVCPFGQKTRESPHQLCSQTGAWDVEVEERNVSPSTAEKVLVALDAEQALCPASRQPTPEAELAGRDPVAQMRGALGPHSGVARQPPEQAIFVGVQ